jgi:hypothetical protein
MANTLAYYDTATIRAVKSYLVQPRVFALLVVSTCNRNQTKCSQSLTVRFVLTFRPGANKLLSVIYGFLN